MDVNIRPVTSLCSGKGAGGFLDVAGLLLQVEAVADGLRLLRVLLFPPASLRLTFAGWVALLAAR